MNYVSSENPLRTSKQLDFVKDKHVNAMDAPAAFSACKALFNALRSDHRYSVKLLLNRYG